MPLWDNSIVYDESMQSYWEAQTRAPDTVMTPLPAASVHGSMVSIVFTRTVEATFVEDVAVTSLHLAVNAGPGAPMVHLSASQAAAVEGSIGGSLLTPLLPALPARWKIKEYVWRNYGADFPLDKTGASMPGPAWRITPVTTPGSSGQTPLPDQLSATVTYRTASRRHWGRTYWPGLDISWLASESYGKLADSRVDTLATAYRAFFNSIAGQPAIVNPWIWSPRFRGALSINELAVDDVADVIRSRRAKYPTYRKVYTS